MTTVRESPLNVLLIEDDPAVTMALTDVLESSGYAVKHAGSGGEARALLDQQQPAVPDLILLDLMLPDSDGLLLCADLKSRGDVPIVICSASEQKRDRLLGFKLGADDFIAKPFDVDELLARLEAVLRRAGASRTPSGTASGGAEAAGTPAGGAPGGATDQQRIGELVIEPSRRRVLLGGQVLQLTPTEYRLLVALASRPDEVLSREELAQQVWGYEDASIGRSIDVHIRRLRAKLAAGPVPPPEIASVRGFGYKIVRETAVSVA